MTNTTGKLFTASEIDRIIQMAWEDRTPFEAISAQFGLLEKDVIVLMRSHLNAGAYRRWRKRMNGRQTKHQDRNKLGANRFKSTLQREITHNKISKR